MRSFYLQFRVYVIEKFAFFWNLSSNLWQTLVFLYANSLYASLFLESLSLAYHEVHLYRLYQNCTERAFHGFGKAKFLDGGSVMGSSQFSMLPQLPPKIQLDLKVVKINPKIIISLR